jgi:hypothetical protein
MNATTLVNYECKILAQKQGSHPLRKITISRLLVPVMVVAALAGAATSASASTTASARPAPAPGVWIAVTQGQSLTSAVLHVSAHSTDYAKRVRAMIPVWAKEVSAGRDPGLPGLAGHSRRGELAALSELNTDLGRQISGLAVPAVDTGDPNTFPIRGQRGSGGLYWTATFITQLYYCGSSCDVTDKYTSNVTINPGATVTQIVSRNLYFPDSGNLQNKHFQMWAVCRGVVCEDKDTGDLPDLPNTGYDYLRDYGDRHGNVLTIALTLWTYWTPLADYASDSGKTHDCTCETTSVGNACMYSY